MSYTIKQDDYARLHFAYHEDTDLAIISDALGDEYEMGWLVWLYWPRMIARAKQARTFGWFSTTPRKLAMSVHDRVTTPDAWVPRERMWNLLADRDLIRIRQECIEGPSSKLDVLIVEWEKWQSLSNREHSKLSRERKRFEAGEPVHWTVRHWSEFAFSPIGGGQDVELDSVIDTDSLSVTGRAGERSGAVIDTNRTPDSVIDTDSLSRRHGSSCGDTDSLSTHEYETRQDEETVVVRARAHEGGPLADQVAPPTTESFAIEQAIAIFLDCSKGGVDEDTWRTQLSMHRSQNPGAPAERYVEAAMQMRAKYLDSKRPFSFPQGWSWFQTSWKNAAAAEHRAARSNIATLPTEPKRRTAQELLDEQNRIWSAPA